MIGKKEEAMAKGSVLSGLEGLLRGMLGDLREIRQAVRKLGRTGRPAAARVRKRRKQAGIKAGGRAVTKVSAPKPERIINKGKRCATPGCGKWASAKGLCHYHYQRMRFRLKHGDKALKRGRPRVEPKACSVKKCGKVVVARGLCATHYQAQRRKRQRRKSSAL